MASRNTPAAYYYEIRTANTTYYGRQTCGAFDLWGGRFQFLTLTQSRPRVGVPMHAHEVYGRVRTSPVRSVRRISYKAFCDALA